MESELEKFRRRKRVEEYKGQVIQNIRNGWARVTGRITRALLPENQDSSSDDDPDSDNHETDKHARTAGRAGSQLKPKKSKKHANSSKDDDATTGSGSQDEETAAKPSESNALAYFVLACKILIWICLFMGFLKLELGAIFVIVSIFWLMWTNTSTRKKKKHGRAAGPSAYSVFNPNCESIDGTLKAEQLEKQLLFRETK